MNARNILHQVKLGVKNLEAVASDPMRLGTSQRQAMDDNQHLKRPDLVERLENTREWVGFPAVPICIEAAREIDRLRAELAAARDAQISATNAMLKAEQALDAERERCAQVVLRELSPELGEEIAAAIRKGE